MMHIYYKFGLFLIFTFSISIYHSSTISTFHQTSLYDNDYQDDYDDYYTENDKIGGGEKEESHINNENSIQAKILTDEAKRRLNPLITSTTTTMKSIFNLFNLPKRSNYVKDPTCPKQCLCLEDFHFINCANAQLKRIPPDIPITAHILDLSHNQIKEIDNNLFENHTKLEELNLMNNQIKYLSKEALRGLTKLNRLQLSANLLTNIEPDTFEEATDLMILDLSNNSIHLKENSSFLNQPSLVELNCRNCSLTQLYDDTFVNTSALQVLRIDQNDFNKKINIQAFKPLKYLIKLRLPDLDQNNIEKLCNLLQTIDNIGFKHFDISCFELVSGTPYNESIILPELSAINNNVNSESKQMLPTQNATILNKQQVTISKGKLFQEVNDSEAKNMNKTEIKVNRNSSNNNSSENIYNNNMTTSAENFHSELEISGFFVTTDPSIITNTNATQTNNNSNKSYQVPVSPETIDRMLIGLMIISVIGIIIGLICRNDVGGIKTKCCRSRKPQENVEVTETPAEEIPLNKIA